MKHILEKIKIGIKKDEYVKLLIYDDELGVVYHKSLPISDEPKKDKELTFPYTFN